MKVKDIPNPNRVTDYIKRLGQLNILLYFSRIAGPFDNGRTLVDKEGRSVALNSETVVDIAKELKEKTIQTLRAYAKAIGITEIDELIEKTEIHE